MEEGVPRGEQRTGRAAKVRGDFRPRLSPTPFRIATMASLPPESAAGGRLSSIGANRLIPTRVLYLFHCNDPVVDPKGLPKDSLQVPHSCRGFC